MKKSTKLIAVTLAATTLMSGAVSFGSSLAKQVDIYYRNIKININGKQYNPTNEQGETVEPFIYDGTTYLPVRAVAAAFDKEVSWDDKTSTVFLKDKEENKENNEDSNKDSTVTDKDKQNDRDSREDEGNENDSQEDKEQENDTAQKAALLKSFAFNTEVDNKITSFVAKKDLDSEILFNVENVPVSAAAVRAIAMMYSASYGFSKDEKVKEAVKQQVIDHFKRNSAVMHIAFERGIDIPEEVFENDLKEVYLSMEGELGDMASEILETYTGQTLHFYFLNGYITLLADEISASLLEDGTVESRIRNEVLEEMNSEQTPYVRAQHVLVLKNEDATQEETAQKLALAEEILAKAKSGEDFTALMEQYGEDPGMVRSPEGYYFTYGKMVVPFEKAAFELEIGGISDIVETTYGYHIIKRLPLDDDAIMKSELYLEKRDAVINEMLLEASEDYNVVYADDFDDRYAVLADN